MSSPRKSPLISHIENLPADVQFLLIEQLSYKSIKKLCGTSGYFAKLCKMERAKKIIQRKYDEKNKYLYYLKTAIPDKVIPFKKQFKKILKAYQVLQTATYGGFLIITNQKISDSEIKPLKYKGEKYVLQIPNKYYDSSLNGVQDSGTKKWYVLSNTYDTKEFSYKKDHSYYPADKTKRNWAVLTFEDEIPKQDFEAVIDYYLS